MMPTRTSRRASFAQAPATRALTPELKRWLEGGAVSGIVPKQVGPVGYGPHRSDSIARSGREDERRPVVEASRSLHADDVDPGRTRHGCGRDGDGAIERARGRGERLAQLHTPGAGVGVVEGADGAVG